MDESLAEHVRTLYATPPAAFVAARNALAKEARRAGRRDDAASIAGLRRPSWVDGALNRVAADEPAFVAEFVEAAGSARRIQHDDASGQRTASLPDALRAMRAAQSRLAARGNAALVELGRKADLAAVTARLGQLGADPVQLALLRAGVLGLEHDELVATFATHDDPGSRTGDQHGLDGESTGDVVTSVDDRDPDARAEHRRQVEAATRAARAADREAQVAATAARRAADRRDRAAAAVDAAEATLRDAERALERARAELAEHTARASEAERDAEGSARLAAEAAGRLDDLSG